MTSIFIAVALSLSSATNYVFVSPSTTNILGVGIGETLDYRIPRQEDNEFLREAYAERTWLNGVLSESAVTNLNPRAFTSHPHTGFDTNAIPHRFKWADLKLYYYNSFLDAAFDSPSNCAYRCAVNFASQTISEMTFVTNVSLYSSPEVAYPFMFDPKGEAIADRKFGELFDSTYGIKSLVFIASPYTNAYHDLTSNDAMTFRQLLRQKDGIVTVSKSTTRYRGGWPDNIDQKTGVVAYKRDTNSNVEGSNDTHYAESWLTFGDTVRVTKQGFSFFHDRSCIGGSDGVETYVYEMTSRPLTTMTVTLSNPIGGCEVVEAKTFAIVTVSHTGYAIGTNIYSRSASTIVPVEASSPYVNEIGQTAIDVTINAQTLFSQASSITGEEIETPFTVESWVPESTRPTSTSWDGYVIGYGPSYSASDQITYMIRWIVGIAKLRYHARVLED